MSYSWESGGLYPKHFKLGGDACAAEYRHVYKNTTVTRRVSSKIVAWNSFGYGC